MSIAAFRYTTQGSWRRQDNAIAVGTKVIAIAVQPTDAVVQPLAEGSFVA